MSQTKRKAAQLELFAVRDSEEIHALGLLGWKDPLWTRKFEITLLGGTKLMLDPLMVRILHDLARKPDPEPPAKNS